MVLSGEKNTPDQMILIEVCPSTNLYECTCEPICVLVALLDVCSPNHFRNESLHSFMGRSISEHAAQCVCGKASSMPMIKEALARVPYLDFLLALYSPGRWVLMLISLRTWLLLLERDKPFHVTMCRSNNEKQISGTSVTEIPHCVRT